MSPLDITHISTAGFMGPAASMGGGMMGFLGQERQNYANAKQASDNRSWQEWMSSTAHTREVADLRAAGLNPILSANRGASTPSGAQAIMGDSAAAAFRGASSAQDLKRQRVEIDNMIEQTENIGADTAQKQSATALNRALQKTAGQDFKLREQQTEEQTWSAKSAREMYTGHRLEGDIDREGTGDWARRIQRFIPFFNSAGSLGRGFRAH